MTGANSVAAGIGIVEHVCGTLFPGADPVLEDFDIEMLNLAFHVGCALLLRGVQEEAVATGLTSIYNPARYPGLRIASSWGTILAFGSGSVLLTGCHGPADAARCTSVFQRLLKPQNVAQATAAPTRAQHLRQKRAQSLIDNVYGAAVRPAGAG